MRNAVTAKRVLLQRGRLKAKLLSLLIPQVKLLMNWEQIARPHVDAVAVLGKVLGVTCLSLPLVQGAQVHGCKNIFLLHLLENLTTKSKEFNLLFRNIVVRLFLYD